MALHICRARDGLLTMAISLFVRLVDTRDAVKRTTLPEQWCSTLDTVSSCAVISAELSADIPSCLHSCRLCCGTGT